MDLSQLREEYKRAELSRATLDEDPIKQFEKWFKEAMETVEKDPNAMSLATVNAEGQPSLRTVLLKYFDHRGFVFFTNYESRKARDIAVNPRVALLFPWLVLERQVKIEGVAEKVSFQETARYFATRPRGSQIGAWVSPQSRVIESRQFLMQKFEEMKAKFGQGEVPVPKHWGGYRVVPHIIEFWQGRPNRLHDRFQYSRQPDGTWRIDRLAP
ncbi:MAG: pyridoxamine 5'-phosphate oxidase [Bacteroidetes bacterium]|nr:MAG: pyridoxamine 5'-phosphate oxidase [Bacteroidota bacterium]